MAVASNSVLAHEALSSLSMVVKNPAGNVWSYWTLLSPVLSLLSHGSSGCSPSSDHSAKQFSRLAQGFLWSPRCSQHSLCEAALCGSLGTR